MHNFADLDKNISQHPLQKVSHFYIYNKKNYNDNDIKCLIHILPPVSVNPTTLHLPSHTMHT